MTAEEISGHHLDKRLPMVDTGDEIASLSQTLNQMICRLEESFQSVNRFTADASHELRTPLTIIRGELETSLWDKSLSENVRNTLYSLIEETEHLSNIVQCLLSLSRLDAGSGQMERVRLNLADLVSSTTDQMSPLADEKRVTLTAQSQGKVDVEGDRVRLKQAVPEIHVGVPVEITVNALQETISGKVSRYSGRVDASTRKMQTEVEVPNPDGRLTPGMYATVRLVLEQSKNALSVPIQSVTLGQKPTVVVLNGDHRLEQRKVTLGLQTANKVEIRSGLADNELVLVGKQPGIQLGQKATGKLIKVPEFD